MRKDIENTEDIKVLVDSFYAKVNEDELLAPIFNTVAKVNWEAHLPRMYAFWNSLLLDSNEYRGQPFDKHAEHSAHIHALHFDRWIRLFSATIDEHFDGPKAKLAKTRAESIGAIFQYKMDFIRMNPIVPEE
ncbi:MAG: group III truncated hemoglobin [Sphingobacteriales bacterium]|nr:group III truncated hemoglobin [Sphingobacteriales bacterium]